MGRKGRGKRGYLWGRRGLGRSGRSRSRYRGDGSRGVNGLGDRFEEGGDFWKELRGAAEFGDSIDDGATHDNSVGEGGDLSRLFGVGDSEADTNGKSGGFFEKGNFFSKGCGKALLHSCHAFTGNVVDEARCGGDEGTNTGFGGGRCDEDDAPQVASGGRSWAASSGGRSRRRSPSAPA